MLITELANTNQKALARELRKIVESNKAQSKQVLKETEIRKLLCKKGLTYYGISDIIAILKTNYSDATVTRLLSKIQRPVVWDTCICNISSQELTNMFYNEDIDSIITTAVYDELLKLSISSEKNKSGIDNAFNLVSVILDDIDSKFCTIVDLPKDTCTNHYVDNQLLWYCSENNYELYTHDYVLGLRARAKNINVKIFTSFNEEKILKYSPNSSGKNIILNIDLLNIVSLPDIVKAAEKIGANKFILTHEFVEALEDTKTKNQNSYLIHFLVLDSDYTYSFFLSEDETSDVSELAEKYNAVVFSSDIKQCLEYRMNYIPYKFVTPSDTIAFKNRIASALALSPYYTSDLVYEDNLDEDKDDVPENDCTEMTVSDDVSLAPMVISTENESNDTNLSIVSEQPQKISSTLIPHYKPKNHQIPVKNLSLHEKIWVLDENGNELTAEFKNGYDAFPGYTVIHVFNTLNDSFKLNVYKIMNSNVENYSSKLISLTFTRENLDNVVSAEYKSFARRAVLLT